jgi:hypothetical protein
MNMTYVPEHQDIVHAVNTMIYNMLMMMKASTKKWQMTTSSGMSCGLQTRRPELYGWPAGL